MDIGKIMRDYNVNEEQARALDIEKNIALHAGAGSGKTRVLSRRFLRLVLEKDAFMESIVAITFTNKAAMEMKERVRSLVNERILKARDPQEMRKASNKKEEIQTANISTFHSFCDRILRENCHTVGLDPMYRIIEDVDRETLLAKVIDEEIDKMMADTRCNKGFKELFLLFGTDYYYKKALAKDIKRLYDKIREKAMSIDEVKTKTLGNISRFYREKGLECFKEAALLEEIELFAAAMLQKVDGSFSAYKLENSLVDFNDLEIFTIKLLEDEGLREHYRQRFKYFLVDEFQDTNQVQRKILYDLVMDNDGAIAPGRLFIVGDVKQSIYGFRGADYEVFNSVTDKISENGEKQELSTCYRSHPDIVNTVNRIFSNLFEDFEPLQHDERYEGRADVEYALIERKKSKGLWKNGKGILKDGSREDVKKFLDELLSEGRDVKEESALRTIEAEKLALKIKGLKSSGFEYKDMAVLFRSRTNLSCFEEALRKHDIPYCMIGGIGFFEKQEIVDIMNILKCIYDPGDKVALLGALRSPYIGVPDDLLLMIFDKLDDGKAKRALEESCTPEEESAGSLDKSGRKALTAALGLLKEMRQKARYYNVSDFVNLIIDSFHMKEIMLALNNGAAMYRNMEKFASIAREFDKKDIYSPGDFFEFLQNLREVSGNEAEAVLDTEDSDAVKIMTIHAAKGLEFEAVFVPEIGRDLTWNTKRSRPNLQFCNEYGIIARFDDKITGQKQTENKLYDFARKEALERELEESKRMLYVAATRAKRYLYFVGENVEPKGDEKLDSFVKMLKGALGGAEAEMPESVSGDGACKQINSGVGDGTDGQIGIKTKERINMNIKASPDNGNVKGLLKRIGFMPDYKIKSSFSISRYFTYNDCPRKFFYIYKAGIDSVHFERDIELSSGLDEKVLAPSPGAFRGIAKGKLIHEILEKAKGNNHGVEQAMRQYAGSFAEDEIREIKRLIQNYFIAEGQYEKKVCGSRLRTDREKAFAVPLLNEGNKTVYGIIDRVDIYVSGDTQDAYLIDYKTNRIKSRDDMEKLAAHYKPQFMLYSLGFERLYPQIYGNIKLKGMFLFFLDIAQAVQISFSEGEIGEYIRRLSSIMDYVESRDDMEDYREKRSCDHSCEFANLCGLKA